MGDGVEWFQTCKYGTQLSRDYFRNHCKDAYSPTRIQWKVYKKVFFVAHLMICPICEMRPKREAEANQKKEKQNQPTKHPNGSMYIISRISRISIHVTCILLDVILMVFHISQYALKHSLDPVL